jgi:hypothetical protein
MKLRLAVILALCVSVSQPANAASVTEADSNSPEYVILEFYRLISFEAGARPDYDGTRKLLADDAVVIFGATSGGDELLDADESLQRIQQSVEEIGFEDYGLQFTVKSINCKTTDATATCVTSVEVAYPGLNIDPIASTDISTLGKRQDRWLATTTALFVKAPDVKPPSILSYPVIHGEPSLVEGPKYERALPFLAQSVIDLGYELPNPYGVAIIPAWIQQDLTLTNLAISVNDGPTQDIDFVDFGTPSVENTTVQLKFDAWVFPFLNAYATVGKIDGKASIPLTIQGADLMDHLGLGSQCNGGLLEPDLCARTLSSEANPNYHGENVSLGINLAAGWKQFFVALPITYVWTNIDIIDTTVEALNISPRVGISGKIGNWGVLSTYIGANYLDAEVDLAGSVTFDTSDSGAPGVGDTTTVDYEISEKNKDKWNYLLGFNWDITRNFSAQAEAGFGGSRTNFISSFTYRY